MAPRLALGLAVGTRRSPETRKRQSRSRSVFRARYLKVFRHVVILQWTLCRRRTFVEHDQPGSNAVLPRHRPHWGSCGSAVDLGSNLGLTELWTEERKCFRNPPPQEIYASLQIKGELCSEYVSFRVLLTCLHYFCSTYIDGGHMRPNP